MEKKIIKVCIGVVILFTNVLNAQDGSTAFERKGIFRTTLTFATGYMPNNNLNNLYLTGNIEYYTSEHISLRGEGYYFFNSMNQDKTLSMNHYMYSGALYHFSNGAFDPFIGLQPGLSYTQCGLPNGDLANPGIEIEKRNATINPLISPIVGFNYYATNWFHLFINVRYSIGTHLSNDAIIPLNEWNASFGLGFNVNALKIGKKKT